jgi:hypothetical protein
LEPVDFDDASSKSRYFSDAVPALRGVRATALTGDRRWRTSDFGDASSKRTSQMQCLPERGVEVHRASRQRYFSDAVPVLRGV